MNERHADKTISVAKHKIYGVIVVLPFADHFKSFEQSTSKKEIECFEWLN